MSLISILISIDIVVAINLAFNTVSFLFNKFLECLSPIYNQVQGPVYQPKPCLSDGN